MTLDRDRYLASLRTDGDALAEAAERAGLDAAVPGCPGWTVADLLHHAGVVGDSWSWIVAGRIDDPSSYAPPPRPADEALGAWCRDRHAALVAALEAAPDETPVWTWASDRTVGFVVRRMAQEFAVHRVDAEQAAGEAGAVDAELASDGIDELLAHFVDPGAESPAVDGSIHVHCTDVPGEWLVRFEGGTSIVTREHAKGDAAVRGPASDLLLALWRRRPLDAVEVIGDRSVVERFLARTDAT